MDKATPDDRVSICVFCGSSPGNDPQYTAAVAAFASAAASRGWQLVFGGGSSGLMGLMARTALDQGGTVVGVTTKQLAGLEPPIADLSELIVTRDLFERKAIMISRSDAFVVLPGGAGTLDEFLEVATTRLLDVHNKPVLLVDVEGYFRGLIGFFAHMRQKGFLSPTRELYEIVASPLQAVTRLEQLLCKVARRD